LGFEGIVTWKLFSTLPYNEQVELSAKVVGKIISMNKIRLYLQGKKTYVVGIGAIVAAVVAWITGNMDQTQAIEAIAAALMGMFIRAGVAKVEQPK
jgi:hypothetical protein